jgi:hypothetical protein
VRGGEDARQAVSELERDRGAVAPARLARGDRVGERGLDKVAAAAPLQHAVVGHEGDGPADPVADGVGVAVGDVRRRDAVVVAHAGDRALVRAKGRAREQQPPRGGFEGPREALAPRQLLAEVVGLVGDDERRAAALPGPALGHAGHPRVLQRRPRLARARRRGDQERAVGP